MMDLAFCITVGDHSILVLPFSFGVCNLPKALFSSKIFCKIDTVALSFVFDKYYLIME